MAVLSDEHLMDDDRTDDVDNSQKQQKTGPGVLAGLFSLRWLNRRLRFRSSALARRIITINLIALSVFLIGTLYLNQFQGGLLEQKQDNLVLQGRYFVETLNNAEGAADIETLPLSEGKAVWLISSNGDILAHSRDDWTAPESPRGISGWIGVAQDWISGVINPDAATQGDTLELALAGLAKSGLEGNDFLRRTTLADGKSILAVVRPMPVEGEQGVMILATLPGYLDDLLFSERETLLRLFLLALVVSIVMSVVLANTIANPIHDLTSAAEAGVTRKGREDEPDRIRIPDLSGRSDEIGRLSSAMRDMTAALYHRIDTNEEFAADVAHEIKNPLASLRSAVETLRIAKEGPGRTKLLDVIEHDVRRLDRLVSDISNASRLDAELVKEEMERFDLTRMLERIVDFHRAEAMENGVELIWDAPRDPIHFEGLEARMAQVFVNLISNAISFCGEGDAVRAWARVRDNRALLVVEDTGPGIPEEALTKVFKRFYSERSEDNFGNNSGLGLSISKQIVEAHHGVIWAENIRRPDMAEDDAPLGARFVVGLPV